MTRRRFFVVHYGRQPRDGGKDHLCHFDGPGNLCGALVAVPTRGGEIEAYVRFETQADPERATKPLRVIETAWEQGLREEREDARPMVQMSLPLFDIAAE